MAEGVGIDLLVYHDMTDYAGARLEKGADAGAELGETFAGYHIVAVGPPINPGKDVTVVLAHGARTATSSASRHPKPSET